MSTGTGGTQSYAHKTQHILLPQKAPYPVPVLGETGIGTPIPYLDGNRGPHPVRAPALFSKFHLSSGAPSSECCDIKTSQWRDMETPKRCNNAAVRNREAPASRETPYAPSSPGATGSAPECISEYRDEHGYIWSYTHTPDEPPETLIAATAMAANVAADLAVKEQKTYVLAVTTAPSVTVFILPFGHPIIMQRALSVIKQLLPDRGHIPGPKPRKH